MDHMDFDTILQQVVQPVPSYPTIEFIGAANTSNSHDLFNARNDPTVNIAGHSVANGHHPPARTETSMPTQYSEGTFSFVHLSHPTPPVNVSQATTLDNYEGRQTRSKADGKRKLAALVEEDSQEDGMNDGDYQPVISRHLTTKREAALRAADAISRQTTPSSTFSDNADMPPRQKRRRSRSLPKCGGSSDETTQRRVCCTWKNCDTTFGRAADRDRHVLNVHKVREEAEETSGNNNGVIERQGIYCGYIFSRLDAWRRHEKKPCSGKPRKPRISQYEMDKMKKGKKKSNKRKKGTRRCGSDC